MPKNTEEYLVSRGLKNAIYTIRAEDVKDDLFGKLVQCPVEVRYHLLASAKKFLWKLLGFFFF